LQQLHGPFACCMQSSKHHARRQLGLTSIHPRGVHAEFSLFLSSQLPSIMRPDTCIDFNTNLTQIEQKFWHPILGSKHSLDALSLPFLCSPLINPPKS
jgi:hypothetical protein